MKSKLHFDSIPKFTGSPNYRINVSWRYLQDTLRQFRVNIDPDFQRGHVWTQPQKTAYVEFRLKGGMTGHELYINKPDLNRGGDGESVLVDGKQRLTAVLEFMEGKLPVFGSYYYGDIEDFPSLEQRVQFILCVNDLRTRAEVLKWYLEMNSGGVVHTQEELDRVTRLLEEELAQKAAEKGRIR